MKAVCGREPQSAARTMAALRPVPSAPTARATPEARSPSFSRRSTEGAFSSSTPQGRRRPFGLRAPRRRRGRRGPAQPGRLGLAPRRLFPGFPPSHAQARLGSSGGCGRLGLLLLKRWAGLRPSLAGAGSLRRGEKLKRDRPSVSKGLESNDAAAGSEGALRGPSLRRAWLRTRRGRGPSASRFTRPSAVFRESTRTTAGTPRPPRRKRRSADFKLSYAFDGKKLRLDPRRTKLS